MSRKILITGANGFVARHLVSALTAFGDGIISVDDGMVFTMGSDTIEPPLLVTYAEKSEILR